MILDEHSDPLKVIAYATELLNKVDEQRKQAKRINKYQKLFKLEGSK